jgi:hypothetical protein
MQTAIEYIVAHASERTLWVRTRTMMLNKIAAQRRRLYGLPLGATLPVGDKRDPVIEDKAARMCVPIIASLDHFNTAIKESDKQLEALAAQLPVAKWWAGHRGMALLGLATVVGEAGGLHNFATVGKLWKYLGLHVVDGSAPKGKKGETLGFAPRRHAVVRQISSSVIRANGLKCVSPCVYRLVYDERKKYEIATHPDHTPKHHHLRAMRYMEKRIIRDLWLQWNERAVIPAEQYAKAA